MSDFESVSLDLLPEHTPIRLNKKDGEPLPCIGVRSWREAEELSFKGTNIFNVPLNPKMQFEGGYHYPMLLWFTEQTDAKYVLVHFDSDYLCERHLREFANPLQWEHEPSTWEDFSKAMSGYLDKRGQQEAISKIRLHAIELHKIKPMLSVDQWFEILMEADKEESKPEPESKPARASGKKTPEAA